jgi:hypothetical protein|tara:strand:- start:231 stop:800 length:570 start_codon:yes stop_codon:yes gene_type:complete
MKSVLLIISISLFLNGCSGISQAMQKSGGLGKINENISSFDGTIEVTIGSAYVAPADGGIPDIRIGASWTNNNPDKIILFVEIISFSDYNSIPSVSLNLDNKITKLTPVEALTNFDYEMFSPSFVLKQSNRLFITDINTIKNIIESRVSKIRVDSDRTYRVGDFRRKSYGNVLFLDGLPTFLNTINKHL